MDDSAYTEQKVAELRKIISTLEWDIPILKEGELKLRKEKELMMYRVELEQLQRMRKFHLS